MRFCTALLLSLMLLPGILPAQTGDAQTTPPIYIAFLWHMHQPIYWPYETVVQTDQNGRYSYSVTDIHNQRWGPYTSWPRVAVQKGITAGLGNFGAQVSFSGSLIENLNTLEGAGNGNFQNWKSHWNTVKNQLTTLGNPRLDMVAFGYHHPLMGLIEYGDIRRQIQTHRQIMAANFPGPYSKGIFPPENAFSPRMIPALADEGIEWVLVDNIHFDRACQGYPFSTSGNLYEANRADERNPNPGDWVQLNGLWAPTRNSARWGRQPHYVQYIDPATGVSRKIIAVPTDRYLGNEDGRGGFGALNYEYVMSQLESYNTDPARPILIVLHHDGDNYGGGSEAYYNSNFQNFVNWVQASPSRFVCTTVQDYLEMFPPDSTDIIHIEDGSWSGADNGDPEFKKWNGDPAGGYSPDRNSWGVVTAARNFAATAAQISPSATGTENAWKYLLNGEASDYWYWDGSQNGTWDSHPARAANLSIPYAQSVIAGGTDLTPPTIYLPQREPYNPGATEWGINQPSDFTVWTYAFDVSGLSSVRLRYRTDLDGVNSNATTHNETYAGGGDVTAWTDIAMTPAVIPSQTSPQPLFKAKEYAALVAGLNNVLVDYYVEATDSNGNTGRSPIMHVWVGQHNGGGTPGVSWEPTAPDRNDPITITVGGASQGAKLHWGVNNSGSSWQTPNAAYWPAGSVLFNGAGPAVESPFAGPDSAGRLTIQVGPFNNAAQQVDRVAFVIHFNDNSWNNNSGQDFHITVSGGGTPPQGYLMDGVVDSTAGIAAAAGGLTLWLGWNGVQLYVATQSAQSQGGDMFILVADSLRAPAPAMWAKAGSVAAWDAFLGNESTNNWSGWFNSAGAVTTTSGVNTAGSILEGALNVEGVFGGIPQTVYVAVGKYQTADGGALVAQAPAGNGNGSIEAAEFLPFRLDSVLTAPAAPILLAPAEDSTGLPQSPTLRWSRSSGAITYALQVATDSLFAGGFAANLTGLTDTQRTVPGLTQYTRYFWRVQARNLGGSSPWSQVRRFTTLLLPPAQVLLSAPPDGATTPEDSVLLVWSSVSPPVTAYRLEAGTDPGFSATITDTTVADTSFLLLALAPDQQHWWRVRALNGAGAGPVSTPRSFTPAEGFLSVGLTWDSGWDLVSLPVATGADSVLQVFPQSLHPYGFSFLNLGGYAAEHRLRGGTGYWAKFGASGSGTISGHAIAADTLLLETGWNLIGAISFAVDTAGVEEDPEGILASPFYSFAGGYVPSQTLAPGRAYWVKAHGPGAIILGAPVRKVAATEELARERTDR